MKWTIPNMLTVARLALLPGVVGLLWPSWQTRQSAFWAAMAYLGAGVLDMVDGAIARWTNQITTLGQFLDPLADKLFYLVTLVTLVQLPGPWVPTWAVMVILTRELAITGLRGIAITEGIVIAAGEGGKVKMAFATAGIYALILHYPYVIHMGFGGFWVDPYKVGLWFTYISMAFSITSAMGYVRGFIRALKKRPVSS